MYCCYGSKQMNKRIFTPAYSSPPQQNKNCHDMYLFKLQNVKAMAVVDTVGGWQHRQGQKETGGLLSRWIRERC